jgi:tetratricopeptide (TPR) repeat protein
MSRFRKAARPASAAVGLVGIAVTAAVPAAGQDTGTSDPAQGGAQVDYGDVLANPDDPEINYRYAKRMIAQGELNRAAAALERILMLSPESDRIRLLYGVVLARLGNTGEALRELEAVDREKLGAGDRRTLDEALGRLRRAQRRFSGSVGVTAGVHVDSNRNSFPEDGRFQVDIPGAGPTSFEAGGNANTDVGQYLLLDGRVAVATDWQRVPEVRAEAALLGDNQVQEDDLDLISGLMSLGTTYYGDGLKVRPRLSYRRIYLAGERYQREVKGSVRLSRNLAADRSLVGFVKGTGAYADYASVALNRFADEQDGTSAAGTIGLSWAPSDALDLTGAYRFRSVNAREAYEAYDEHRARLSAVYVPGPGISLSAEGFTAWRDYDGPDPFVSRTTVREETEILGRLGAAVTVPRIERELGISLPDSVTDNLQLSVYAQVRDVAANLPNFAYRNYRAEFAVTKRFSF